MAYDESIIGARKLDRDDLSRRHEENDSPFAHGDPEIPSAVAVALRGGPLTEAAEQNEIDDEDPVTSPYDSSTVPTHDEVINELAAWQDAQVDVFLAKIALIIATARTAARAAGMRPPTSFTMLLTDVSAVDEKIISDLEDRLKILKWAVSHDYTSGKSEFSITLS